MPPVIPSDVESRYRWSEVLEFAKGMTRNVPLDKVGKTQCDIISAEMWRCYPWPDTCQNIPAGQLPLVSGDQAVATPDYLWRLLKAQIQRTLPDIKPYEPLNVATTLPATFIRAHPQSIRKAAMMKAEGIIRLDAIPDFDTSESFDLLGEYQLRHVRVLTIDEQVWWPNDMIYAAAEGLIAWAYKLADRPRSFEAQMRIFRLKLKEMWEQEDVGSEDQFAPLEGSIGSDISSW